MAQLSAGLLLFRRREGGLECLVVHPGGPFFKKKDAGAWSLPKGLADEGEDLLVCARREVEEELGQPVREDGPFLPLGEVRLKSGKRVTAWALEQDLDTERIESNPFELEWPPRSGKRQRFPEVDRAAWLPPEEAKRKLSPAQRPFVDRLCEALGVGPSPLT